MKNTLYYGDNLEVIRKYIKDESVDLIYLDPPFNSNADYNIFFEEPTGKKSEAQVMVFTDTWSWGTEAEKIFQEIVDTAPGNIVNLMLALKSIFPKSSMLAYLTMMCVRLIELRRILKDTGSIYLHCDTTASHYLKILMDTIFTPKNFRNEIVWSYSGRENPKQKVFPRKHDIIFFYTKTEKYIFNLPFKPYREKYIKQFFTGRDEDGRIYQLQSNGKDGTYKQYLDKSKGQPINDSWTNIKPIWFRGMQKEALHYPTQKPEALLERIIKVSSKEGDIVLDPFCGCGTAVVVAEKLKRKWIGIDVTCLATLLIERRFKKDKTIGDVSYNVVGLPKDLESAKKLARQGRQGRYEFQWWALTLIGAKPPEWHPKKGADSGIDGYYYFNDGGKTKKVIISVKSGGVGVGDIRDLHGVSDRESATMGFLITLKQPTKPMIEEAIVKGFYTDSFGNKYPKTQILLVEELLKGKKPDTPPQYPIYKNNVQGIKVEKNKQGEI